MITARRKPRPANDTCPWLAPRAAPHLRLIPRREATTTHFSSKSQRSSSSFFPPSLSATSLCNPPTAPDTAAAPWPQPPHCELVVRSHRRQPCPLEARSGPCVLLPPAAIHGGISAIATSRGPAAPPSSAAPAPMLHRGRCCHSVWCCGRASAARW